MLPVAASLQHDCATLACSLSCSLAVISGALAVAREADDSHVVDVVCSTFCVWHDVVTDRSIGARAVLVVEWDAT